MATPIDKKLNGTNTMRWIQDDYNKILLPVAMAVSVFWPEFRQAHALKVDKIFGKDTATQIGLFFGGKLPNVETYYTMLNTVQKAQNDAEKQKQLQEAAKVNSGGSFWDIIKKVFDIAVVNTITAPVVTIKKAVDIITKSSPKSTVKQSTDGDTEIINTTTGGGLTTGTNTPGVEPDNSFLLIAGAALIALGFFKKK